MKTFKDLEDGEVFCSENYAQYTKVLEESELYNAVLRSDSSVCVKFPDDAVTFTPEEAYADSVWCED